MNTVGLQIVDAGKYSVEYFLGVGLSIHACNVKVDLHGQYQLVKSFPTTPLTCGFEP